LITVINLGIEFIAGSDLGTKRSDYVYFVDETMYVCMLLLNFNVMLTV